MIKEYNAEAAENAAGFKGLATIRNDKVSEFAVTSMEGIQEVANIYLHTGDGTSDKYYEWSDELQDVYLAEAVKTREAYMQSAK